MSVHNPQFLLQLSARAKIKMTQKLTAVNKDWGKCCVFSLYKTDSYLTSTKGLTSATQSKYLTSDSCSHEAELEEGSYIILCCSPTYKPKNPEKNAIIHAGPMTFTVNNAPAGSTLGEAQLKGVSLKKTLAFKGNGCGGYGSYKNPQFFLTLKEKSAISVNMKVSLPNPKIAVCIWMLPMDPSTDFGSDGQPQRMANFDQNHPRFKSSSYLSSGAVDLEVSEPLEPGTYVILTMTNNKEPREVTLEALIKDDPNATLDGKEIADVKEKLEENFGSILALGRPEKKKVVRDITLEKAYNIEEAHKVVDKITVECKKKNKANGGKYSNKIALFKDPDFAHAASSLNSDGAKKTVGKEVQNWLRPHEIVERPELFSAGIDSSDIAQGFLGDCWFCAVVSAIATRPDKITKLFYPATYNPAGIYSVSLWNGSEWVAVIIDDALPCSSSGMQVFARGVDKSEFWFPLIEKAAAKLVGSYQMLMGSSNSGLKSLGLMELLTGGKGHHLAANPKDDAWFPTLRDYLSRGWICSIASEEGAKSGIVGYHAYTAIAVHEAKGGKLQLIRVRNTWGHGEWKGAYGDHDPIWKKDKALAKACDMEKGAVEDGMFWMTRKDFEDNFENMNFCAFPSDNEEDRTWTKKKRTGQVEDAAAMHKPSSSILKHEQILMETDGSWTKRRCLR